MKKMMMIFVLGFVPLQFSSTHNLCRGFLPPNSKFVSEMAINKSTIDKQAFLEIIDHAEQIYGPIIKEKFGAKLTIIDRWSDDEVNAYAYRSGSTYYVEIMGGMARHPAMTEDAILGVLCHEIGHHIGGAPKSSGWSSWASNEGQSDYFAMLKCMRRMFTDDENQEWVNNNNIAEIPKRECELAYADDAEKNRCMRMAMASFALGIMLADPDPAPNFETPDPSIVSRTNDNHPQAQCRLDTYYGAGLCNIKLDDEVSQKDPNQGTCNRVRNDQMGVRPLCWYKP